MNNKKNMNQIKMKLDGLMSRNLDCHRKIRIYNVQDRNMFTFIRLDRGSCPFHTRLSVRN